MADNLTNQKSIFRASDGKIRPDKLVGVDFPSTDFDTTLDTSGNVSQVKLNVNYLNSLFQQFLDANGYVKG